MRSHCLLASLAVVGMLAAGASADVVHLKDGTRIEGDVKHADDGWNVRTETRVIHISPDDLESIELTGSTAAGPMVAADRLASLRRSVVYLNDLNEIVTRFQRFVDTCNDPAVLAEAKKDLAIWQDRTHQKMTKVGGKWVSPADRVKLIDQAAVSADQARQLMKQGRSNEAEALLSKAIAVDPHNPAALYLVGLLRYQQEQIPAARKAFDTVAAAVPNHAPTLNNLAIVQWRQRQYVPALANYDGAMLASPVNKLILDNVATAMLALPPEFQKSPVAARTLRHFQEQDQALSDQMGRAGLHRYGALWESDHDMDQMREQDKQTQDKLDALAGNFDRGKAYISQLDQNISDYQAQIDHIAATSVVGQAGSGVPVQIPYPQIYFDLTHEIQQMQQDRAVELAKLDAMKRRADDLQKNRLGEKMNGLQRMIGPEGTPLREMPTTQPTNP